MLDIKIPKYENIPDVGLYLEQVTKYINQNVPEDMSLTSTMITNYVKLQIVPKGHKKMYSNSQIALFIIIAFSKSVLSMEQIKTLFNYYDVPSKIDTYYDIFINGLKGEEVSDPLIYNLTNQIINKIKLDSQIRTINNFLNDVRINKKSKEEKN